MRFRQIMDHIAYKISYIAYKISYLYTISDMSDYRINSKTAC